MNFFTNLDLLSVGLTTAAIGLLGASVFFSARKSITSQAFLFFTAITIFWGWVNYSNYQVHTTSTAFWLTKLTLFFATWHAFGIYQFFYVFPEETIVYNNLYKYVLFPLASVVSIIVLTPAALVRISAFTPDGKIAQIQNGPGMGLFGLAIFCFVILGIKLLVTKLRSAANAQQKIQLKIILFGTIVTFSLLLTFNFILPAFFNMPRFIPLGMVFILPFILATAYAIMRHGLLNVRVVATELLTFALLVVTFMEIVVTRDVLSAVFRVIVFIFILVFGMLLTGSVKREIEQREKLEQLTKELQTANIRLKEIDQQKTDFLSIAAHQLRTPLSILNGYIELIKDGAYGKVHLKTKEILDNMDASNLHLIKLVDEFLDISRLDQGRTKYDFKENDIVEIIDGVIKEQSVRVEKKGLKLHWVKPKQPIKAVFDDEKVRHVIYNFVDNAAKYSEHGTITTTVELENGGITVRVKDHGFGFDKVDEANFFQKFYRGNNVRNKEVSGTGLGLYVCSKFIDGHKGKIWAHSEGLGKGSEFGFWIPNKS